MMALTACAAFFFGKLEAKDFMLLAGNAFTFYFAFKGGTSSATDSEASSYAGK